VALMRVLQWLTRVKGQLVLMQSHACSWMLDGRRTEAYGAMKEIVALDLESFSTVCELIQKAQILVFFT
jgi:hypothetical protein